MSQNVLHPAERRRASRARPLHGHSGERILYGQRINGVVRVTDRPAAGHGRSYLIERGLEQDGYSALKALIADYTSQAGRLDEVPMAMSLDSGHDRAGSRVSLRRRTALGSLPVPAPTPPDRRTLRVRGVGQRPRTGRAIPWKERHEHHLSVSRPNAQGRARESVER